MPLPRIGVVIVTMGNRPRELEALLASVERQDVPATRVVLVGNATPLTDVVTDATKIPLTENLGCPGGRNVGLELLRDSGEVDVVVELGSVERVAHRGSLSSCNGPTSDHAGR
ncbi:hypothetical protein AB0I44_07825, partial [Streptomyces sp. NPDC050600]